jgi:WD40 repeat protein
MKLRRVIGITVCFCALLGCWAAQKTPAPITPATSPTPAKETLAIPVSYGAASTPRGTRSNTCVVTRGPVVPVAALAFSPEGKTLAAGGYGEVALWDLDNARLAKRLGAGQLSESVLALLFTKDGKGLIVADGVPRASGSVKVFDLQTGKLRCCFQGPKDVVDAVALSADEKLLAAGSADKTAYVWSLADNKLVTSIKDHSNWVQTVSFSPDGKLFASGGADRNLLVWEVGTWKLRERLPQPEPVFGSTFSPDGSNLVWTVGGPDNRSLRIRKAVDDPADKTSAAPSSGQQPEPRQTRTTDLGPGTPFQVVFAPDGSRLFVACSDKTVKVCDRGGSLQSSLAGHEDWVYCVAVSTDGTKLASGSADGTARLWSVPDGRLLATLIELSPRADDWLIIIPAGYFATSAPGALQWKPASTNSTPEQLVALLRNPESVKAALAGKPVAPPAPPKAAPVAPPALKGAAKPAPSAR